MVDELAECGPAVGPAAVCRVRRWAAVKVRGARRASISLSRSDPAQQSEWRGAGQSSQ